MKKIFAVIALLPLLGMGNGQFTVPQWSQNPQVAGPGTITIVHSCTSNSTTKSGTTVPICTINGQTAGNLNVSCIYILSAYGATTFSISDGTTTFTMRTAQHLTVSYNTSYQICGYNLSANSGNKSFVMSCGGDNPNCYSMDQIEAWVAEISSSTGTWHFDSGNGSNSGNSTSTASSSGTFSTSGTTEAIFFDSAIAYNGAAATTSSPSIGGNTPSEFSFSPLTAVGSDHKYYLFNTSVTSGACTLTYSTGTYWVNTCMAFKAY